MTHRKKWHLIGAAWFVCFAPFMWVVTTYVPYGEENAGLALALYFILLLVIASKIASNRPHPPLTH